MSGNGYRNTFLQFVLIMALCLCYFLVGSPWIFSACAGTQAYYIVESYNNPNVIYKIEDGKAKDFFTCYIGKIKSIAVWNGEMYFSLIGGNVIYKMAGQNEANRHFSRGGGEIQGIAFDPKGMLCFSEVDHNNARVIIYGIFRDGSGNLYDRIRNSVPLDRGEGNFRFDMEGKLYISSGNRTPAYISLIEGNRFAELYRDDKGVIKGIAIEPYNPSFIYYANGMSAIYRINRKLNERSIAFLLRDKMEFSDVAFDMRQDILNRYEMKQMYQR